MSRLTVTEKEHWKSRIEKRISKAIENIELKDPMLMASIDAKALAKAHKELGTSELTNKLEALKRTREALTDEESQLTLALYAQAFGRPPKLHDSKWQLEGEFSSLLQKQRSRFEVELLQACKIGKEIIRLRTEKEALLDTIWLATSSLQIRELWNRVADVIGDQATDLQQRILAEEPNQLSSD